MIQRNGSITCFRRNWRDGKIWWSLGRARPSLTNRRQMGRSEELLRCNVHLQRIHQLPDMFPWGWRPSSVSSWAMLYFSPRLPYWLTGCQPHRLPRAPRLPPVYQSGNTDQLRYSAPDEGHGDNWSLFQMEYAKMVDRLQVFSSCVCILIVISSAPFCVFIVERTEVDLL